MLIAGTAEEKKWIADDRQPVTILVDARGQPARLAAVMLADNQIEWCELVPPPSFWRRGASELLSVCI